MKIQPQKNKLVLIDLDDTLCNSSIAYKKAHQASFLFLKKIKPDLSKKKFDKLYTKSRNYIHKQLGPTASSHNRFLYFQKMFEILELPIRPITLNKIAELYWNTTYKNLKLLPTVKETLQILQQSNIKLGMVSNLLTHIQIKKLEHLDIAQHFDFIVCSEEAGKEKPFPPIFKLAKEKAKTYKNCTIYMVGDDEKSDIEGANKMGFISVYIGNKNSSKSNFSIKKLKELLPIVGLISKPKKYIKFDYILKKTISLKNSQTKVLNIYRNKLFKKNLIGVTSKGIGFGNISTRYNKNKFIITGNATGILPNLKPEHFSLVTSCDFSKNQIEYSGKVAPSSESLSHAALYEANSKINSVVHIHNSALWKKLENILPSTPSNIKYGTPAMANALKKLLKNKKNYNKGIIRMGGHKDGFMLFGENFDSIDENLKLLFKL